MMGTDTQTECAELNATLNLQRKAAKLPQLKALLTAFEAM